MKIISLNVGMPRLVMRGSTPVSTAIFKQPVAGRVMLRTLNLDGDRQSDLSVHGGPTKAVYAYPSEHYPFWQKEFPEMNLPWGIFGENLTTEGMDETEINIGDKFRVGEALIMVTEPRLPCYKLGLRFGRSDVIKKFLKSERTGFYFSVLKEGTVGAGDELELTERDPNELRVRDVTSLFAHDKQNRVLLQRALAVEALPESWKKHFRQLQIED
ncbi:MAG TPA: MOSC domain-containing protein [Pyrinomonadaceae bacterium]|nr:MOSC domain-containing protein [Pyrinomonadaceae bacterium]